MSQQGDALNALYTGITETVGEIADYDTQSKAIVLKNLALAYRYAAGGPQPGGADAKG